MAAKGPRVGDRAPDFSLPDEAGESHRLDDYQGRWLVLFFYPKDETPGCVAETCGFRDRYEAFVQQGVAVLGVSRDSAESHRAFKANRRIPFPLLSDPRASAVSAYGALGLLGIPKRVTFLIDPRGVVRAVHDSHLRPGSHVMSMVEALQRLR